MQNIALALHEAGALGAYYSGGVDTYRHLLSRRLRQLTKHVAPDIDRQLSRRAITTVPPEFVYRDWTWELPRALARRLGLGARLQDWCWERSEHRLDGRCAHLMEDAGFDVFFGVEHGALSSIRAAKRLGKRSVVAFLSPHHTARERWVDKEYEKFPALLTKDTRRLMELGRMRDARRDEEACLADVIHSNSTFTTRSLVAAGFPEDKIATVAYGSPPALVEQALPSALARPLRFVYAGPVSVRKGTHYLIDAWRKLGIRRGAELHFYGVPLLPGHYIRACPTTVIFHGSVPPQELFAAYQQGAALVFPTLLDGFGLVVTEALANGLPVITTHNAGASSCIDEARNGFLVPPGDSDSLAERLAWCTAHPDQLLEMRRYALAAARRWTWSDFRASLRRQLGQLLDLQLDDPYPGEPMAARPSF